MEESFGKRLNVEIVEPRNPLFAEQLRVIAAFGKWWGGMNPRHRSIIIIGLLLIMIGITDLGLFVFFNIPTWLFWANDILVIFG